MSLPLCERTSLTPQKPGGELAAFYSK